MKTLDDLRTAHAEGSTFVAYGDDNISIVTGGSDGDLRVYPGLYDDETASVTVGTKVTCLAVEGNLVAVANDAHEVKSYSLPSLQLENVLLRFTASINHVNINNEQKMLAAASSDFSIKSVNLDGTNQKTYIGHEAPVLSLYVGTKNMISSSCDGTIRIWNFDDQKCIKTLDVLPKSNSIVDNVCWISVTEKGDKNLAVPCDKTIKIMSTDSWQEKFKLEEHNDVVTIVKWSPCGKYLASGARNGEIFGWDMSTKKCFSKFQHHEKKCVTSLNWNEKNDGELLFAGIEGEFGYCQLPIKNDTESKDKNEDMIMDDIDMGDDINIDEEMNMGDSLVSSSGGKQKKRVVQMDDDDDDDDDDIMPTLSKKRKMSRNNSLLDDHADVDHDDDGEDGKEDKDGNAKKNDIYAEKEDDVEEDYRDPYDIDNDIYEDNNTTMSLIKEGLIPESKPDLEDEDSRPSIVDDKPPPVKYVKPVEMELQEAFQPSATGINLLHRFMVWNSVGIIRCHVEDDVSHIDVEFHDTSTYHPLHIPNVLNHTMAALSETAVVFACESDDSMPSKLVCTHFGSWDSNKDWDVSMPDGENIEAIAANRTHIVAATNERLIRIFTISGTQTQLFSLQGPVVSMAMHEKQLMIFYLKSGGFNECHCFGVLQLHLRKNGWKIVSDGTFISKPKSILSWIGFSNEGTPVIVESSGDVLLIHRQQVSWIPIANTKKQLKSKSDSYWIIGVEENQKQIRCIYSRGTSFPTTSPRPVPTVIPFQVPLCEIVTEKSIKEEELIKCCLTSSNINYNTKSLRTKIEEELQDVERQQIRLFMQLFALACKSDQEFRAVEICNMMPNAECVGMAIQYACKVRKMALGEKLTELARKKAAAEEEEAEEENEDVEYEVEETDVQEEDIEEEEEHETHGFSQNNKSRTAISSGPKMAIIRPKSISSSRSVEVREEEDSQDIELSPSEVTSSESIVKRNSLPPGGNPFKRNKPQPVVTDEKSRGTDYFETLLSQHITKKATAKTDDLPANKSKKITEKKSLNKKKSTISFTTNRKKTTASESKTTNKNGESPKLSGFQLYMKKLIEDEGESENIVPKAMRLWKQLSTDDKEEWNEKAKSGQNTNHVLTLKEDNKITDNADEYNVDKESDNKKIEIKGEQISKENKTKMPNGKSCDTKKVSEVKNASRQKLAAFSFQPK